MEEFDHQSCGCHSTHSTAAYGQTMSEMDFTRGVWTDAMDGDLKRVESYLEKGGDPNATDSSGYSPLVSVVVPGGRVFLFLQPF